MEARENDTTYHLHNIGDPKRLQVLFESTLLDTASEEVYDRFTTLAATLVNAPVALVSLVDKDRQYFKSYYGLPEPWASYQETPLSHSICQYVVSYREPIIVQDTRKDPFLSKNLSVSEMGVIAYLGFPLMVKNQALGSLCVTDNKPHIWSEHEINIVRQLARFVATEIALRIEVAEHQKVTNQFLESEERFSTLANHAPIIIWQSNANGDNTLLNTTWYTFTGLSEEESLGSGWINAVHPDDRARTNELWNRAVAQRTPFHTEYRLQRADGVYRDAISHGTPYIHPATGELSYIGTVLDITEQRDLDRQRKTFFGIVTHELKTPLTVQQANIQLAQRRIKRVMDQAEQLQPEERETLTQALGFLKQSQESSHMQNRLINDLLDLARVQTEKLELHLVPTDLIPLVQQTAQEQQMSAPQRRISLALQTTIPVMVLGDAERIKQVLVNYITNALKYSPADQPIQVQVSSDTMQARVSVRDHGIGLSPTQQAHIWDLFYQTHEIAVPAGTSPGLGLGLHICQELIHAQQGEVGVISAKGQGSTFWFTLPLFHPTAISPTRADETAKEEMS